MAGPGWSLQVQMLVVGEFWVPILDFSPLVQLTDFQDDNKI